MSDIIRQISAYSTDGTLKSGIGHMLANSMSPGTALAGNYLAGNHSPAPFSDDACKTIQERYREACYKQGSILAAWLDDGLVESFDGTCTLYYESRSVAMLHKARYQMRCKTDPSLSDGPEFDSKIVKLPYIVDGWEVDAREACQYQRTGIDVSRRHTDAAGRATRLGVNDAIINGVDQYDLPGLLDHGPDGHGGEAYDMGGNPLDFMQSGSDIVCKLTSLVSTIKDKKCDEGPLHVVLPCEWESLLVQDYSAECCGVSIREILMKKLEACGVSRLIFDQCMPKNKVAVYSADIDTVTLLNGLNPIIIPEVDRMHCLTSFKSLAIWVPTFTPRAIKTAEGMEYTTLVSIGCYNTDGEGLPLVPVKVTPDDAEEKRKARTEAAAKKPAASKPKAA